MASSSVVVLFTAVLLAAFALPALSQVAVDNSYCEQNHLSCPGPHNKNYQKYCCLDTSNGFPLFACCNPYIGWIIGLCVGVPSIILLVVFIVLTYFMCARYRNKRMEAAMASYRHNRRGSDTVAVVDAPPVYTPISDGDDPSDMLPSYTATDPFPDLRPIVEHIDQQHSGESQAVAGQEEDGGHVTSEDSQVTSEDSHVTSVDSQVTSEDAPLIEAED